MTFGLRGNRVWNGGSCSWISTPFSHFPPALFSLFSWIPFFCFPSTLVQSLLEGKKWKKWRGREEGFFPLSPYSHPLDVFSCSLFFAPPPVVFNRLLSGARRLVWFKGTELNHCTVSHILSLTDQIILRLIIDVKSLSNYWYARTTSSFLASSCNSGALVRSSVCKLLLLDSLGQFFYL